MQFGGTVLLEEVPPVGFSGVEAVGAQQPDHVVHVLFDPAWVAMPDGVGFERQQMLEADRADSGGGYWSVHCGRCELMEGRLADDHQIQGQGHRVRRVELDEREAFSVAGVAHRKRQLAPFSQRRPRHHQVEIERIAGMPVRDDGMPSNQQEGKPPFAGTLGKDGENHSISDSGSSKSSGKLREFLRASKANGGQ